MSGDTAAVATCGLGKRYRRRWALSECTFSLPPGRICGLVGANGAGKSTLLRILAGLSAPDAGSFELLGERPGPGRVAWRGVAYLDQDRPLYRRFSVAETLRAAAALNPVFDEGWAARALDDLGIGTERRVGTLSGGQRAQVALTWCLARRPALLLLDEPTAALDPLARESLVRLLLDAVAENGTTVIVSSHAVAELGQFCDSLVLLTHSRVCLAGDVEELLGTHRLLVGAAGSPPPGAVLASATTGRQATVLVRAEEGLFAPGWDVEPVDLEQLVIAYLRRDAGEDDPPELTAVPAAGRRP